jgi:MFS family permease
MLISSLFFQGIGSAMIVVTELAILTNVFPSGERGKALGFVVGTVYVGLSLGPLIGGFLTHNFGWRSIFLLNLPLGLVTLTLIFWKIKQEWSNAKGEKFDLLGSIIYGITLVAVMYGLSLLPDFFGLLMILLGAAGILVFIRWELKVKSPVLNMNLFRQNTTFTFGNLAALINYSAVFAAIFLLSLYLQFIKGFNPLDAGLILVSQPIMMAIFSPLAGRLSDRIEPRIVASSGMALTSVSLFLLTFLNADTTLEFIVAILIFFGFSLAFFASPNTNSVMSSVEKRFYGVASGTLGTMRQTGMMISMGIVMLIFTIYIGRVQITPELYPLFLRSMNVAFMVFAVLCFGGVFASIRRGKVPKPGQS